jgi:hypothetical protein
VEALLIHGKAPSAELREKWVKRQTKSMRLCWNVSAKTDVYTSATILRSGQDWPMGVDAWCKYRICHEPLEDLDYARNLVNWVIWIIPTYYSTLRRYFRVDTYSIYRQAWMCISCLRLFAIEPALSRGWLVSSGY